MTKPPRADLLPKDEGTGAYTVEVALNALEYEHLERLHMTGFFGHSIKETVHRLLDEALAARCL